MSEVRKIYSVQKSRTTMEGAGVRLKRAFGQAHQKLDPFLLLDDFGSDNPDDYLAGFPWHPHRGIETITYMLHGEVLHEDSMGNSGTIQSGDVQWMTAGSGIVHQELPARTAGTFAGFQLWANLPAAHKMMDPRYRDIKKTDIPTVTIDDFIEIKVICGEVQGIKGPVQDIITDPEYLDISMNHFSTLKHPIKNTHNAFAYVIEGEGYFDEKQKIGNENLVIFESGDEIQVNTENSKLRFLLISGKPLEEPVAWSGPIVMNTQEELRIAFEEYRNDTFVKKQ
ncbi:MAG: pirin family protein [Candidatus Heimdallarchaeota archaeon]|nr:pirin family protein [Candidatus Heimdallarchaeota archaeon]